MQIRLNGVQRDVRATSVAELLQELELASEKVAVEVNHELVPRRLHGATVLRPGDAVELVTLVGGG